MDPPIHQSISRKKASRQVKRSSRRSFRKQATLQIQKIDEEEEKNQDLGRSRSLARLHARRECLCATALAAEFLLQWFLVCVYSSPEQPGFFQASSLMIIRSLNSIDIDGLWKPTLLVLVTYWLLCALTIWLVVEQVTGRDHVLNHLSIPATCFTHLEISMVRLTEPQAREKGEKEGFKVSVAKTSFKANTKALAEN